MVPVHYDTQHSVAYSVFSMQPTGRSESVVRRAVIPRQRESSADSLYDSLCVLHKTPYERGHTTLARHIRVS